MTFPEYFQEVQTLITKEIDLPFDCPFPQTWIDENTATFKMFQYYSITPSAAVSIHFTRIDQMALIMLSRRKLNNKLKYRAL